MKSTFACASSALSAALLLGCGSTNRQAELRQMRERVEALQTRLAKVETQLVDAQNQIFLVNDQLERERSQAEATRPPPRLQVVKLAPPTAKPAAAAPARPAAGAPEPEVFSLELDGSSEPGDLPVASVPPPAPIPRHDAAEAESTFREALKAFREGRTAEASKLFSAFVERYPDHAYADNALYWMAASRLEAKAWTEAADGFRRLLLRYPRSRKVPDALFGMGVAYEKLGARTESRQAFVDLVTNYPSSALADLARARLGGDTGGAR